ncbi:hypothetical protein F5879DRAFT_657497 [Lentinula edodes]|uniref:uncharacterized protein n=1 Tax=Lentinula edodes TaxID=5353 RepID=UPI001E8D2969|nr:uncharacterized protein C8R40DRAFT_697585 [Lentinula edodes]KAH7879039.1 hypothetical protein C8R40DRAFT_697585 [Lentinula edodes]KAJ3898056.1 hypothetical protein F5879DRAFT_657497 [Lentinula edodes]
MRPSLLLLPTLPVLMACLTILSPVTAGSVLTRRTGDFEVGVAYGDCDGPWIAKLTPGTPTQSRLVLVGQCYAALDITSMPGFSHPSEVANSGYADEFCIVFIKPLPDVCRLVVYTLFDGDIGSPRGGFVSGPIEAGEQRLESHLRKLEVHCDEKKTGEKRVSGGSAQQKGPGNPNRKKQRLDGRSRKWQ